MPSSILSTYAQYLQMVSVSAECNTSSQRLVGSAPRFEVTWSTSLDLVDDVVHMFPQDLGLPSMCNGKGRARSLGFELKEMLKELLLDSLISHW